MKQKTKIFLLLSSVFIVSRDKLIMLGNINGIVFLLFVNK